MTVAITHAPSPNLGRYESTFVERVAIDGEVARRQHESYCEMLRSCGAEVVVLETNRDHPDSVFVEDTAIVLDELAILTPMGTESRRPEPAGIEPTLRQYREVRTVGRPALLEGGDVLRIGRRLLVGLSSRTNAAGIAAMQSLVEPLGYSVTVVEVRGCLHFKTACTALPDGRLVVNPAWIDISALAGYETIETPSEEPWSANVLLMGETVCLPEAHARMVERVRAEGFGVKTVDLSEFAKAEGGITCSSLVVS